MSFCFSSCRVRRTDGRTTRTKCHFVFHHHHVVSDGRTNKRTRRSADKSVIFVTSCRVRQTDEADKRSVIYVSICHMSVRRVMVIIVSLHSLVTFSLSFCFGEFSFVTALKRALRTIGGWERGGRGGKRGE